MEILLLGRCFYMSVYARYLCNALLPVRLHLHNKTYGSFMHSSRGEFPVGESRAPLGMHGPCPYSLAKSHPKPKTQKPENPKPSTCRRHFVQPLTRYLPASPLQLFAVPALWRCREQRSEAKAQEEKQFTYASLQTKIGVCNLK